MNNPTPTDRKTVGKSVLIFRGVMLGLLIGAGISILPVWGIRRSLDLVLNEPAQSIFFAEWILASAITGGALLPQLILRDLPLQEFPEKNRTKQLLRHLIMPFCATFFLLLYFSATALCQRLDMGVIRGAASATQILRYVGLLIGSLGLALQAYSLIAPAGPKSEETSDDVTIRPGIMNLRHPCFFATLVTLTGLPLLMGTWYPLFAIPGTFIVMKWIITEQERTLRDKYGSAYEQFQAKTKRLIPYCY